MNPIQPQPERRLFGELLEQCARPSAHNWPHARQYLTTVRCLDGDLVDRLHAAGTIYANDRGGIVFLHTSRHGGVLGASVRSIYGDLRQCIGSKVNAWFAVGQLATATRVVVTESPIDALSFQQIEPHPDQAVLSVAGNHVPHPLLLMLATRRDAEPVIALDNNPGGHSGALKAARIWELFDTGRHLARITPAAEDWNCDLIARTRDNTIASTRYGAPAREVQP